MYLGGMFFSEEWRMQGKIVDFPLHLLVNLGHGQILANYGFIVKSWRLYLQGNSLALEVYSDTAAKMTRQDFENGPIFAEASALLAKAESGAALWPTAHLCKNNVATILV